MLRRTVLEWRGLRYGDAESDLETIPAEMADRVAAIAAASSLPGTVLEHGRNGLRARGVVGVIAAEGCSLEILPKLDVGGGELGEQAPAIRKRLVHMLALALDMRIDVGALTELHWQRESLLEILIRVFAEKLIEAVRRGMPRRYIQQEDDLPALRGSLNVVRQFTVHAVNPSRLACRFDNLSEDIALNRIMKAAVARLLFVAQSNDNQRRLRELAFIYADIAEVPVAELEWDKVTIDRTSERWRELLNLARLLLDNRLQTTTSGDSRGFALLFEMSSLFEEYVGRLAALAFRGPGLQVTLQGGLRYCLTGEDSQLFQTKPDILIKRGNDIACIIDTKWKQIAPQADDGKQGVSQSDVYQVMAYSQIYECPKVVLLYPHNVHLGNSEGIRARYAITGSDATLHLATIDVAQERSLAANIAFLKELAEHSMGRPNLAAVGS